MIKREVYDTLNGFDESYTRHQDYEFLLRFFSKYKIGMAIDAITYIGRNDTDNRPTAKDLEYIKNKLLTEFETLIDRRPNINILKKHALSAKYTDLFFAYLKEGDVINSVRMFENGIKYANTRYIQDVFKYSFEYAKQKIGI